MAKPKGFSPIAGLRIVLWIVIAIMGAGAGAFYLLTVIGPQASIGTYGGGSYALVNDKGDPVTEAMLTGHPSLLFFGFTHCPDICPTTLSQIIYWLDEVGPEAQSVKAYFVNVDPERDTQAVLSDYLDWTDGRVTGVTGPVAELDKLKAARRVTAKKVPDDHGGYTMDHVASVFLIRPDGSLQATIAYLESWDTAIAKLRRLVAG